MKSPIKFGACLLFAGVAVMLAGCGSHDQNSPSTAAGSQATPPEIVQNAKKQQEEMRNHPPPAAYVPPTH